MDLSAAGLTRYGIRPEDDGPHPHSPDHEWWNESWFWDWHDDQGRRAGHVRIGLHPNQGRAWVWCYLHRQGEWLALEQPRLPLEHVSLPDLAYDRWGLTFSWEVEAPLRRNRLTLRGFGRVISGPRAGLVLPFAVDLTFEAAGPPFSQGGARVEGHHAEGYETNRFEQPMRVSGTVAHGTTGSERFEGDGERDHSWGPRAWDMEWCLLVTGHRDLRLFWVHVDIPGIDRITTGYLVRGGEPAIVEAVDDDLEFSPDLGRSVAGPFTAVADGVSTLSGRVDTLAAAEIDITHCFAPPRATTYRRALVRVTLDDDRPPTIGWVEYNGFGAH